MDDDWLIIDSDGQIADEFTAVESQQSTVNAPTDSSTTPSTTPSTSPPTAVPAPTTTTSNPLPPSQTRIPPPTPSSIDPIALLKLRMGTKKKKKKSNRKKKGYAVTCALEAIKGEGKKGKNKRNGGGVSVPC